MIINSIKNSGLRVALLVGGFSLCVSGAGLAQMPACPVVGGADTLTEVACDSGAESDITVEVLDERLEEIPEEILRTEIITAARSPLTGDPLTAAEYAQLIADLEAPAGDPMVSPNIEYLVFLLQIRRALKPILPFIK